MSNLAKKDIKKLCRNGNCSPVENDMGAEKCTLCDGYFAGNGVDDLYLEENNESGTCSLCGKEENICIMKGSGQFICMNECDDKETDEELDT